MDAVHGRRDERISSSSRQRGQRLSMTSRIEELGKLLMMPIAPMGQIFDRDDAALLEEYLTEAGIRVLEQDEEPNARQVDVAREVNFQEWSMVLQNFSAGYARKVDHLQHLVSDLRESLWEEDNNNHPNAEPSPGRRRAASDGGATHEFTSIQLQPATAGARHAAAPAGPPPSLPRQYSELRARDPRPDRELYSYLDGTTIGTLDNFLVCRRTWRGRLVDELEANGDDEEEPEEQPSAQPSLLELANEHMAAGTHTPAPPATPPPYSPRSPSPPPRPRTPPPDLAPLATSTPLPRRPERGPERRPERTHERTPAPGVQEMICRIEEWLPVVRRFFYPEDGWIRHTVQDAGGALLRRRRPLRARRADADFRGFDSLWMDIYGFRGWEAAEGGEACAAVQRQSKALQSGESDDDGFFERGSSLSPSLLDPPPAPAPGARPSPSEDQRPRSPQVGAAVEFLSWQEEVARRAAVARPMDLNVLARDVRRELTADSSGEPVPWRALLQRVRHRQPQPSHVLFDVLQKASQGELELLHGEPGSIGDFSLRLCSPSRSPPPDP